MVLSGKSRKLQRNIWWATVAGLLSLALTVPTVLADTPAVTDFGQSDTTVQPAWQQELQTSPQYAVFLTLYHDGRRQMDIRPIQGDAVVSFRTDHPAWELSPTLMWFWDMPVYVREIDEPADATTL